MVLYAWRDFEIRKNRKVPEGIMKITAYHISIGLGVLVVFLSSLLITNYFDLCFICHGIAPIFNELLFCCLIQISPLIGFGLLLLGFYGIICNIGESKNVSRTGKRFTE